MPDIYGNISPLTDAPEVASTDNIRPANLSVQMPEFTPFQATDDPQGGNDLYKLMVDVNKDTSSQPWVKNSIYTSPVIHTPFKFTTRYLDPNLGFDATDKDLEVKYGANQGIISRVFNRLAKTGATAAVSFAEQLNSTINLLSGNDNISNQGVSAGNEWLERLDQEVLPNYQTQYQKDHPLLSYLPNPFEMKSFLDNVGNITQNLGYTIGAMAGAAVLDVPVAAVTEGLGEIPLLAKQSAKIFSSIGKLGRVLAGSAEEYNTYKAAINSGEDVLKALATASNIKRGTNTVRFLNSSLLSAYGESVMEGNNIYRETKKALQDQYTDKWGNYTGDEATSAKIDEAAKNAGHIGLKANMAFLSISNMFGLGSVLRPGAAAIKATEESLAKEVSIKLAENNINAFELVANKAKGIGKLFANGNRAGTLLLENSKEAVEEGYQFGIQKGTEEYYTRKFNDKANTDVNALSESINNAFKNVFTTTEGQENMLMGLVGGLVQAGAQGIIQNRQGLVTGAKLGEHIVKNLNQYTPTSLFNVARNEAVTSADIVREMQDAAKSGDMFKYKNLQHQALFNLVDSGVRANKFDARIEQLEALKDLSKENFETLFNLELNENNRATVSQYVDGLIGKARDIKSDIDKVNTIFGSNPYSKKDESKYLAFENYKSELGLSISEQRDHLNRVKAIRDTLSSRAPGAMYEPLINLSSETGIQETIESFNKRITDLKNSEQLAKEDPALTKSMTQEREFLENKVKEINDSLTNERTYQKDFLGTINSIHNYYNNGNSLKGDSNISRIDSIDIFNRSKDINALAENTKRIQRYYDELTGDNGFKNFAEDFGRRVTAYQDRIRVDKDGNMRILSDEELDAETAIPDNTEENKQYIKNTLDVASPVEGEEKIDKEDKELIAKLLDDGETPEEGEKSYADKIRSGEIPITDEMKETAKNRLKAEFEDSTSNDTEEAPVETKGKSKAEIRAEKVKQQAKSKGVNIVAEDQDEASDINDIMEADLKARTTTTPTSDISDEEYNNFIDKNIATKERLQSIADKVRKGEKLNDRENAIFTGKTSEINDIIKNYKESETPPIPASQPTEVTSNPFVRMWSKFIFSPLKELNRIFSFNNDKNKVDYKSNLDRLILGNMSPENLHKNVISKITLEVVKSTFGKSSDTRSLMAYFQKGEKRFFDNLYRAGYDIDANVMVGDKQIGILHPPTSLQFKRGTEFLTLDQLRDAAEYAAVTLNPASTFDQFKKDFAEYTAAYNEAIKGFKSGEMLHVNNEQVLKIFKPVVSYGSVDITSKAKDSTLIKDLKYRGKGDAILSFPVLLNDATGRYERASAPSILNQKDLTENQIAETLEYVGNNLDKIHSQDVRYIYLMRMPDGTFSDQSILVARPDDENQVNLDGYLNQIKSALNNEDHQSYFKLNAELGEAVYIAHNRRTGNQTMRKTSARFSIKRNEKKNKNSVILTIFNKGLNHNKKIEFSTEEISNLNSMADLISLANNKITEAEKTDRYLQKIGLELTPESFKKNIPNDEDASTEDLENRLKVSVRPKVFANTSITMMPANGEVYVPPAVADGRKRRNVVPKTTGAETKISGEPKTSGNQRTAGIPKETALPKVGTTYTDKDGNKRIITQVKDDGTFFSKDPTITGEQEAVKGDSIDLVKTKSEPSSSNTKETEVKIPTTNVAATAHQEKIAEDIVNKNLNNIINQLKEQGLLKTDC